MEARSILSWSHTLVEGIAHPFGMCFAHRLCRSFITVEALLISNVADQSICFSIGQLYLVTELAK